MNPWMNGGGSYFNSSGGWANHTVRWNSGYDHFGQNGGFDRQASDDFYRRQQLEGEQNRAVMERAAIASQTQQLQSRGLYENYYNAGQDYYGQGMLSGGNWGGVPYAAGNLSARFSF